MGEQARPDSRAISSTGPEGPSSRPIAECEQSLFPSHKEGPPRAGLFYGWRSGPDENPVVRKGAVGARRQSNFVRLVLKGRAIERSRAWASKLAQTVERSVRLVPKGRAVGLWPNASNPSSPAMKSPRQRRAFLAQDRVRQRPAIPIMQLGATTDGGHAG